MGGKRAETMARWGLKDNHFIFMPPVDENELKQVATGREDEISRLCNLIKRPRGILIFGMYGIGKTFLVKEVLRRLRSEGVIDIYTTFDRQDSFRKTILKGLSKRMADADFKEAAQVYETLTKGKKMSAKRKLDQKGADLYAAFAKGRLDALREEIEGITLEIENPRDAISELIALLTKKGKSVVIAVDDLERYADIASIQQVIDDTRDIMSFGDSLILTGHPIGVTRDLRTSSGGILTEIPLERLSEEELVEMMAKYLNTARRHNRLDHGTHPYHSEAAAWIAREMVRFQLTPRLFNLACYHLFEEAAKEGCEKIDLEVVRRHWPIIAIKLIENLKEQDKEFLKILYRTGGLSEDSEEAILQIGGELAEYGQVQNMLGHLIRQDILVEREKNQKKFIELNPIIKENYHLLNKEIAED